MLLVYIEKYLRFNKMSKNIKEDRRLQTDYSCGEYKDIESERERE